METFTSYNEALSAAKAITDNQSYAVFYKKLTASNTQEVQEFAKRLDKIALVKNHLHIEGELPKPF